MRLLAAGIAASINCCLLPAGTASPVPPPGEDHSLTSGGGGLPVDTVCVDGGIEKFAPCMACLRKKAWQLYYLFLCVWMLA